MSSIQPNCTLWKKRDKTKLKSVCTVEVQAGKTLNLRAGDPTTNGSTTLIRYDVVSDPSQQSVHTETNTEEFAWNGKYHEVTTQIINGLITDSAKTDTDDARWY